MPTEQLFAGYSLLYAPLKCGRSSSLRIQIAETIPYFFGSPALMKAEVEYSPQHVLYPFTAAVPHLQCTHVEQYS